MLGGDSNSICAQPYMLCGRGKAVCLKLRFLSPSGGIEVSLGCRPFIAQIVHDASKDFIQVESDVTHQRCPNEANDMETG